MRCLLVVVEGFPYPKGLRAIPADHPILYIFRCQTPFPVLTTSKGSKGFPAYSRFSYIITDIRGI
jgi:hypothetical protein